MVHTTGTREYYLFRGIQYYVSTSVYQQQEAQEDSLSFFEIRRKESESLRDFVKRFNSMELEIPSCPSEVLISTFTQRLEGGDLFQSLVKRTPYTYDDLLARVEKYINVEETQKQQREDRNEVEGRGERRPTRLEQRKDIPRATDTSKYCNFHREYGHDTSECQKLDREIEKAIQNNSKVKGLLTQDERRSSGGQGRRPRGPPWVRTGGARDPGPGRAPSQTRALDQGREQRPAVPEPNQHPETPARLVIHMISGGSTDGDSHRARKAWARKKSLGVGKGSEPDTPVISFRP
ncbi:uncharacterized protein [Henckelia pumila]|uniref:uncharacterized protein n=1 Tax=Henckelia pumila TaxID=405737 RepID=UPI003C6DF6A0